MLGRTHFLTGAVAGYVAGGPVGMVAGSMAALLPDIDTPDSTVGRLVKPISWIIAHTFGHRTIFHSVWPLLLAYPFMDGSKAALAAMIGYASHLILDALTPEGIAPLWPVPFRLAVPLVRTGGIVDNLLSVGMLAAGLYFLGSLSGSVHF